MPDLLGYWLTGERGAERTNASTTQLYGARSHEWSTDLLARLDLPTRLLPPLRSPGDVVGTLLPQVAAAVGLRPETPVIAVGSHDTASAVVGVPAGDAPYAYVSSGTWSLVGLELDAPVLTDAAREADFTNEAGVDGTVRFLQQRHRSVGAVRVPAPVGGRRHPGQRPRLGAGRRGRAAGEWPRRRRGRPPAAAAGRHAGPGRDAGGGGGRRRAADTGGVRPAGPRQPGRRPTAATSRTAAALAGVEPEVVHVVGGGSENRLLCQLTADACGLPVVAGPKEAAALGNVLVQARALGVEMPTLTEMRALVRATQRLTRYEPR